jgi:hypothetical protein
MPLFSCKRCFYTSKQKSNLRTHLSRKHACTVGIHGQDIECSVLFDELGDLRERHHNVECVWCTEKYSCDKSLSRHRKTCPCRPIESKSTGEQIDKLEQMHTQFLDNFDNLVNEKVQQILKNKSEIRNQEIHGNNQEIHGNNQEINEIHSNNQEIHEIHGNVYNINIHALGSENVSYVDNTFLRECVMDVRANGIPSYIKHVHLNNEYPENKNIRLKSKKHKLLETYDGKKWKLEGANNVLDKLIKKGCLIIERHFLNSWETEFNTPDLPESLSNTFQKIRSNPDNIRHTNVFCKIRESVFLLFVDDKLNAVLCDPQGSTNVIENTLNTTID